MPVTAPTAVEGVPRPPGVGFFGRDETLLALDRAFDTHRIVLLHAYAGAGKTSTAAEFARWYTTTGGLTTNSDTSGPGTGSPGTGAVLWTSFEHYLPLPRVLDVIGTTFGSLLEANGIHWAAITDPNTRLNLVVQILKAVPVLWIWDNIEPIAGFPTNTPSAWTDAEQRELVEFLHTLRSETRAKLLLTSRRPEHHWLGGLPHRVQLPPMPLREQLQLAHALAGGIGELDWRPLLEFTGGNPLTITVTLRQALREHVTTTDELHQSSWPGCRPGTPAGKTPTTPPRAATPPWPPPWATASTTPSPHPSAPGWRCCTCSATPPTPKPCA